MTTFLADLRYAARVLWKHRGVNAVALITLALAIGANTAIFSVYNALLVRALPFPDSGALVQVARGYPDGVGDSVAVPKFLRWRDGSGAVFQGIAAYAHSGTGFNLHRRGILELRRFTAQRSRRSRSPRLRLPSGTPVDLDDAAGRELARSRSRASSRNVRSASSSGTCRLAVHESIVLSPTRASKRDAPSFSSK